MGKSILVAFADSFLGIILFIKGFELAINWLIWVPVWLVIYESDSSATYALLFTPVIY